MSQTKESITLCLQCGKKYVDLEIQGIMCDSCQQYNQTEIDLAGAIRQARLESGGLTLQRIAKIIHECLKDDTKGLLKELMKYEIL